MYDVERFGIINTGNPKHADIFLVTGSVNEQNISVIKQIYEQMPKPKVVVAVGICATSGGVFKECYNIMGGIDTVIPVDVYVPGCAARPEAIIDGVVKGLGVLAEKQANLPKELAEERAAGVAASWTPEKDTTEDVIRVEAGADGDGATELVSESGAGNAGGPDAGVNGAEAEVLASEAGADNAGADGAGAPDAADAGENGWQPPRSAPDDADAGENEKGEA
jgi:ech hydrogenase subunit C